MGKYGFLGTLRMVRNVILTKIFYSKARVIRFPFDIRNRKYIDLGTSLTTGTGCRLEAHPITEDSDAKCIIIGKNVELNDYVHIVAREKVEIQDNVLVAGKVFISDLNHGSYGRDGMHDSPLTLPNDRKLYSTPVVIEEGAWIGESVVILQGVTVGKGSIIGAMSVVTKNIPPYSIATGIPAKVIKKYDFEKNQWISVE